MEGQIKKESGLDIRLGDGGMYITFVKDPYEDAHFFEAFFSESDMRELYHYLRDLYKLRGKGV